MVVAGIFAGALLSVILEEAWDRARKMIMEKPATKIFEDSSKKLKDKRMIENIDMRDFLKLCDRVKCPESRKIIESVYRNLDVTEQEKIQLFIDFKEIFLGKEEDLRIVFEEFLRIFLQEVVENCKDTDWKYWVWLQLKQKSRQKILLESFEEALHFNIKEPKWFRGSPFWIDFEENRIYRRKEVDVMREKLEKGNIQIIYGDAASGKSTIVKYIGYEYSKEPKPVYLINLKTDSLERYTENITDLLDKDGLLIIEDAHLAFHDVNWVVSKAFGQRLRVLISTRPVEYATIFREPIRFEILMKNEESSTEIIASNGAEEIVEFYFFRRYRKNSAKISGETVKDLILEYGKDLWLLSFALEAFSPETGVDTDKIYESINKKYLEKIEVGINKFVLDSHKYLHSLCVFYQYEIPICKEFLLGNLDLNETYLNQLIKAGEILQKGRMLFLHHSSRAKHFLNAMYHHKLHEEKEETRLINRYIRSFNEFACNVIEKIGIYPYNRFDLVRDLISDTEVMRGIANGIDKTDNLEVIGLCVWAIAVSNESMARELVPSVARKIDETSDLEKIDSCLSRILIPDSNLAKEIINKTDIKKLIRNIDMFFDIKEIEGHLLAILEIDKEMAKKIVDRIDVEKLARKIDETSDSWKFRYCLSGIAKISEKTARRIVEKIDIERLLGKLDDNDSLLGTEVFLSQIIGVNENMARFFLSDIAGKIDKTNSLQPIGTFFFILSSHSEKIAGEIAERIDIEKLARKIEETEDLTVIEVCVSTIGGISEEIARELVPSVARKINETRDLRKIGSCLFGIAKGLPPMGGNENIAKEIIEKIGIKRLAGKVDESDDLLGTSEYLLEIAEIDESIAKEIASNIAKKIDKSDSLWEIGTFFSWTAETNGKMAKEVVERIDIEKLADKLNKTEHLGCIGTCLFGIVRTSEIATRKILERTDMERLINKIDEVGDLEEIGLCLLAIAKGNENIVRRIIEKIDIEKLARKIEETSNLLKIKSCFSVIIKIKKTSANQILNQLSSEKRDRIMQLFKY